MSDTPYSPVGIRDQPNVDPQGAASRPLPVGVSTRVATLQTDDRGTVCEILDPRWGWHPDPIVYSYFCTLRPGKVKGWAAHRTHDDRYFVLTGEVKVVLYDGRPESPTHGLLVEVMLTEWHRELLSIPAGVWHANYNVGTKDAMIVNFPTQPYNHAHPDKTRLPIDTDQIPYRFPAGATGG